MLGWFSYLGNGPVANLVQAIMKINPIPKASLGFSVAIFPDVEPSRTIQNTYEIKGTLERNLLHRFGRPAMKDRCKNLKRNPECISEYHLGSSI